ncbi:hypothetical protein V1477_019060 [Vespula maculifrons]|uniref:Uncharacterized protein n=1 Tax=Vespula maculifrons TaxID=7453 RepID=A0ABD2AT75_VESMC
MQLPPRGGTWVCGTCNILKFIVIQVLPSEWLLISNKCGAASSRITESDTPPLKKGIVKKSTNLLRDASVKSIFSNRQF